MKPFLSQDAAHGALATLYAAVAPEAVAGGYYGPDGIAELKGYPTSVPVPKMRWMKPLRSGFGWNLSASHM